jgi:rRNA maturation protein Nop10
MRRCVICNVEREDEYFIGFVCRDCFREKGAQICCICGRPLEEEEGGRYWRNGYVRDYPYPVAGRVCDECASRLYECRHCGEYALSIEAFRYIELGSRMTDEWLCEGCFHDNYETCSCCGGFIYVAEDVYYRVEDYNGRELVLCSECINHYSTCDRCGRYVFEDYVVVDDDGNDYCPTCFDERRGERVLEEILEEEEGEDEEHEVINRYSYKPFPKFHLFPTEKTEKGRPLFMGVELEIDGGGEDHYFAELILSEGYPGFLYAKKDGSLQNGFEIVSHPATLAFHLIEAGWENVLRKAHELGYTSHDNKRCGLHIHINRTFWGPDEEDWEIGELKLLIFFERFWDKIVKFSRRTPSQIERYCSRYGTEDIETAKRQNGDNRYYALNFQNRYTIEIRIFRGTLRIDTFFATLQFVHYLCHYLKERSAHELQKATWESFVKGIPEWMVELKEYLKRRGLAP